MPNVKVLLNEQIEKLGNVGEVVSVKPGYARNYLLPQNLAVIPTPGEIKRIQKKKELLEKQYQEERTKAEEIDKKLTEIGQIEIAAESGEAGKLFGSITAKDIAEKISDELGIPFERKQIILKKSLNELGEYDIKLKLHNEITAQIKLVIKKVE